MAAADFEKHLIAGDGKCMGLVLLGAHPVHHPPALTAAFCILGSANTQVCSCL